jgi:hypothetical protein
MRKKVIQSFRKWHTAKIDIYQLENEILSLLGENELGVSDETITNGALHEVRKSEGVADVLDKESGSSVEITLGNRIESKEDFFCQGQWRLGRSNKKCKQQCDFCKLHFKKNLIDS